MEKFFKIKEAGSTVRIEVMAGLTTFFAMAYIIFTNPQILSDPLFIMNAENAEAVKSSVFIATCLAAALGTFLMAFYARLPFAQAPGMGLNAFFAYTVVLGMGYTFNQALAIVLISGILFIIITAVGLREVIYKAIPKSVRTAIAAGIGLFIALIGFLNSGIVVANESTTVAMVSFTEWNAQTAAAVLALIGLLLMAVLLKLRVKGAILISILATTIIGIPMGVTDVSGFAVALPDFGNWASTGLGQCFTGFGGLIDTSAGIVGAIASIVMVIITFSMVDMFDTIGTLVGTASKAGMIDENGDMPRMKQALMCDAIATAGGAILGTSTVTTFVESSTGVSEGGRTGMTSAVTGLLFLLSLFLFPIVGIVPAAATAPAFIIVGVMMLSSVKEINFSDMSEAVPAFLTIVMMPFTYSIATGIAAGIISYVLIKLFTGKIKETHPVAWVIAILFIIKFAFMG